MTDRLRPEGFSGFTPSTQQARDAALLRATTDLFVQEVLHDRDEIRRYEELATHLLAKVPVADRIHIAERLAIRTDAPQAIMRMLGKDQIEVARTMLARSPVLGPLDLLAIIAATGPQHHALIARRPDLSSDVMKALRVSGDLDLVGLLDSMEEAVRQPARTEFRSTVKAAAPAAGDISPDTISAPPAHVSAARPLANWVSHRESIALRSNRFDPQQFLGLDRTARLRVMAELATRPPVRHYGGSSDRLDRAFRSILGAAQIVGFARTGDRKALAEAIAEGTDVQVEFVRSCLADATGEPLAVLLKALGLENAQAQQVFLLATTQVGRDVTAFFKVCDLYAAMEPVVAETLIEAWREGHRPQSARHEPLFAENAERRRTGAADLSRERTTPAVQRPERLSGG
jgi:uncharacterized protein (DUF2336 family)